jgi:diguanylate cyclase (GGDEF)-like protein/PAS domain S-box-containing protein
MRSLRPSGAVRSHADVHAPAGQALGLGLAAAIVDVHGAILQMRDRDTLFRELCHGLAQGGLRSASVWISNPNTGDLVTAASVGEPAPVERAIPRRSARAASARIRRLRSVAPPPATAGFPLLCGGQPVALLQVEAHRAEDLSASALGLLEKLARHLSLALDGLEDQRHKYAAERALLDNAMRFRDAAGAAGEYVWEVDLEGHFTYLSEGIEAITGYRPEELVGRKPIDLMPEQDRERVRAWVERNVGEDGAFRDFEHQLLSRHGEARWVRVSAVGLLDADGKRIGQRGTGRDITERKRADQLLAESRDFLDELINAVPDPISVKDEQHRFVAANHAFCRIVGCPREAILGKDDSGLIPAEEARQVWHTDEAALRGTDPVVYERGVTLQGVRRWVLVRKSGITRSDGSRAVLSVFTDITERRAMEQAVRASETRFRDFTAAASEFVWENDLDGRFIYVSSRVLSVWGYSEAEMLGHTPAQFTAPGEAERVRDWLASHQQPDGSFRDLEQRILTKNGEERWLLVNAVGMFDDGGRRVGQRGAARDITERKHAEARIAELATRDPLSGLPNRVLLNDRLLHALASARRRKDWVGLMFIDLDRFKHVNDSLGHEVGDDLLRAVARRFKSCLRDSDTLARLGGDEFVVVLDSLHSADDAKVAADKILRCLSDPFCIGPHTLVTSASIGVSIFPTDAEDVATLMRHADTAMYHAKGMGRNAVQFFSGEMNQRAVERHLLETALREALEGEQFRLAYQPQLDATSDRLVGAEALIRWHHPEWGEISPGKFIPLAEDSGLIAPIGDWVLRAACRQLQAWQAFPALRVAVNLSIGQLRDSAQFLERARATIGEFAVDPTRLEFEITETLLASNVAEHARVLRQLGELGCAISVDDFGTGYSSLSYLKRLPIDTVKIDRSFVRDIVSEPDDAAIVSAVVAMAKKLKLDVVAEGVETQRQLQVLRELGCDRYQGYLFSPAVASEEFAERFLAM